MHSLDLIVNPKVLKNIYIYIYIYIYAFSLSLYVPISQRMKNFIYEQSFASNLVVAMCSFG